MIVTMHARRIGGLSFDRAGKCIPKRNPWWKVARGAARVWWLRGRMPWKSADELTVKEQSVVTLAWS